MDTSEETCSHCLNSEHDIDVKGRKYLEDGEVVHYLICHACCTQLRHYHFNEEHEQSQSFWFQVWENLELASCVEVA